MLLWNHPRGHFHILQVPRNLFCDPSPFQGQTRGISCTKRHLKHLPLLLNLTPASSRATITSPGTLGLPLRSELNKNRSCSLIDRQVGRLTSVSASQLQVFYCASNRGNRDDAAGVSAVKHAAVYFANRSSLYFTRLLFLPSLPSLPSLFLSFFNFLMGPLLASLAPPSFLRFPPLSLCM